MEALSMNSWDGRSCRHHECAGSSGAEAVELGFRSSSPGASSPGALAVRFSHRLNQLLLHPFCQALSQRL